MKTTTLPYWGQIIGLVSRQPAIEQTLQKTAKSAVLPVSQGRSLFITRQPLDTDDNNIATNNATLYRLDNVGEQVSLSTTALPCAMDAIIKTADDAIILLGCDGHLYQTDWQGETINKISTESLLTSITNTVSSTASADIESLPSDHRTLQAVAMSTLQQAIVVLYPNHIVICPIFGHTATEPSTQAVGTRVIVQPYPDDQPRRATALGTSSDGKWLVVGDDLGNVSSYQWISGNDNSNDARGQLIQSSSKPLHQGRVNALCFEPVGHYFFSAGADKHLYRTHVQGELQAIDRAKSSQHGQMITALCVSDTRLFSSADDGSIKSWAFDKGQPNTCKEDLSKTQRLVYTSYAEKPALLAVGTDQSLRFLPIDDAQNGKLLTVANIINDGYHRVQQLLTDSSNNSEAAFLDGIALLKSQVDNQTVKLVGRILADRSNGLSASRALQLVQWLAGISLKARVPILEEQLSSPRSSSVRLAAFDGLASATTDTSSAALPAYLEYALGRSTEDVISAALQSYLKIAIRDTDRQRRVLPILQDALSHAMLPVRRQALASLEHLLPDSSPKADFMALESRYPDTIQAGLIRLYQRGLLDHPEVSRQLMLLQGHHQAEVRQTAFYTALLAQPALITALKQQALVQNDAQLLRTLTDFDDFRLLRGTVFDNLEIDKRTTDYDGLLDIKIGARFEHQNKTKNVPQSTTQSETDDSQAVSLALSAQDFAIQTEQTPAKKGKEASKNTPNAAVLTRPILSNSCLEPLLQNLSNRYEDISFRAAYALACLQDNRAFGTLIRFIHHNNDVIIRAGVAAALGHLQLADGKAILPTLLDDTDAGVRQVAMNALGKLANDDLAWVAFGFASTHQDIHERALAILLTQVLNNKKAPYDASSMSAILQQALNNPFTSIRLEVVKVLLNRELERASKTAIISMIEQLQHSLFEDVHQVALEEWQRLLLQNTSKTGEPQDGADTYQSVLTLLLADDFASIRKQAFDTALKNSKRLGFTDLLLTALASPYLDIKRLALSHLQAKANNQQLRTLMPALVGLLADDSMDLRQQALEVALTLTDMGMSFNHRTDDSTNDDNTSLANCEDLFNAGLNSPHPDIQLTVAKMVASQASGYPEPLKTQCEAKVYAVFTQYLNEDMPVSAGNTKNNEDYKQWHHHITEALTGLAVFSDPKKYHALEWYARYLHHPDADFKALAPKLMYITTAQDAEVLATWQKDERPLVRQSASLALAVWGDSRGQHFFSNTASNGARTSATHHDSLSHLIEPMGPIQWLQARSGLGITQSQQLRALFDTQSYTPAVRLLLIFNALAAPLIRPERLIEALSFADNDTTVVYAHILARFGLPLISNWQYLSEHLSLKIGNILSAHPAVLTMLSETSGTKARSTTDTRASILSTVDVNRLQQFAYLTQHEQPLIRAEAVQVLGNLSHLLTQQAYAPEAQVFTALQEWQRSIDTLLKRHHCPNHTDDFQQTRANSTDTDHTYQTLAFGAWLGVIRESKDNHSNTEQAIRGVMWLATQPTVSNTISASDHPSTATDWSDSVSRVLLPLLHHNHIETRELVWDCLSKLPIPASRLAEHAMSTPYRDMVKRGLQCLIGSLETESASTDSKDDVDAANNQKLKNLLTTNNQLLAEETYQLLKERIGHLPASLMALHTESLPLLRQLVSEWRQITVHPINVAITTDSSEQRLSEQALRQDKLTFLLQARHCQDWQARYQTFIQLIDFDEVLFTNTWFIDTLLIDDLFVFLMESTSKYEQSQALALITQVLQSCQRIQAAHTSEIDKGAIEQVAQTAYRQLLALLDNSSLRLSNADLYQNIATLRDTHMAAPLRHRLQKMFEHPERYSHQERQQLFDTLVTVSGYDQPINDYLGEHKDMRWLQRQHLRDLEALLSLFTLLLRYADYAHAAQLLKSLAWIPTVCTQDDEHRLGKNRQDRAVNKNKDNAADRNDIAIRIDNSLALSYEQLPAKHIQNLIEAVAYRAKKRKNDAGTLKNILKKALSHKEAQVPFLAAEGLALCGNSEGLSTLMASIDYHTDGDIRRRSVLAIGEMMRVKPTDMSTQPPFTQTTEMTTALYKAYDKLIKLAEDDEHYLQDVACEALGHIAHGGHFEYSTQIFALLKAQLSDSELQPYNPAITHWLNGLRWLDTAAAWAEIRSHIQRQLHHQQLLFAPQQHAISLLAYHDSAENKALLLDILRQHTDQEAILTTAYAAAQNLWGNRTDHIYPYDWVAIQNTNEAFTATLATLSLKRIVTHSSIDTLAPFITQYNHQLPAQTFTILKNALLAKSDISQSQLRGLIDSSDAQIQHIGLSYLTQYPSQYLDAQMQSDCKQYLMTAQHKWQALLDIVSTQSALINQDAWLTNVQHVVTTITKLLWLTCRYTAPDGSVFEWLAVQLTSPVISSVTVLATAVSQYWQQALLGLLARQEKDDHLLANLIPVLTTIDNTEIMQLAVENKALLSNLLERLSVQGDQSAKATEAKPIPTDTLQTDLSLQLLVWIKAKDAAALYRCAQDSHAETSIRVRAIEALGQLHDPNIGTWLESLMNGSASADHHTDSDIQKLAYKVLRRWQRGMTRAQQKRPQAPNREVLKAAHKKPTTKQQNQVEGHHYDQ
ncbi:HEAT repeat domain-containing protein [Psychrobacter sp. AOP22-C1-C5]|uniref:HEAT repeat domain-containing protein n=1 Tax=Psychrobacter sp. AOP22-C1-C5 TaxID=3457716 RepID=UPI004036E77F